MPHFHFCSRAWLDLRPSQLRFFLASSIARPKFSFRIFNSFIIRALKPPPSSSRTHRKSRISAVSLMCYASFPVPLPFKPSLLDSTVRPFFAFSITGELIDVLLRFRLRPPSMTKCPAQARALFRLPLLTAAIDVPIQAWQCTQLLEPALIFT